MGRASCVAPYPRWGRVTPGRAPGLTLEGTPPTLTGPWRRRGPRRAPSSYLSRRRGRAREARDPRRDPSPREGFFVPRKQPKRYGETEEEEAPMRYEFEKDGSTAA